MPKAYNPQHYRGHKSLLWFVKVEPLASKSGHVNEIAENHAYVRASCIVLLVLDRAVSTAGS